MMIVNEEYRVTFGQKYRHETHPTWARAHPDGWLTIIAPSVTVARVAAVKMLGTAWCDIHLPRGDDTHWYTLGELHRVFAKRVDLSPVTVCSECLSEACWQGTFMCDLAQGASTVLIPAWQAS